MNDKPIFVSTPKHDKPTHTYIGDNYNYSKFDWHYAGMAMNVSTLGMFYCYLPHNQGRNFTIFDMKDMKPIADDNEDLSVLLYRRKDI